MDKKTLRDVELKGKRVVMRVDFNVPMAKDGSGKITDDTRIVAALPSIKYVLEQGGSLVLMSHLGRPKGVKLGATPNPDNAAFTLKPVAEALSEKLGLQVKFVPDCMAADDVVKALQPGEVALLENTRFYKAEDGKVKKDDEKKGIHLTDEEFATKKAELKAARQEMAKKLASYGDIYCNDAFGTAHRAHASTAVIADYIQPAVSGFLLEKELKFLGDAVENPVRPFVAILGGAKVSDKLAVVKNLLNKVDTLIIAGGMAYTFKKAQGLKVGNSLCEDEQVAYCKEMIEAAASKGVKLLLPVDNVIADKFPAEKDASDITMKVCEGDIPDGWMGSRHRPQVGRALLRRDQQREDGSLERPHGLLRVRASREGHLRRLRRCRHCEGQGRYFDHRRWRFRQRGEEERQGCRDVPHLDGRRRFARIP